MPFRKTKRKIRVERLGHLLMQETPIVPVSARKPGTARSVVETSQREPAVTGNTLRGWLVTVEIDWDLRLFVI